MKNLKALTEKRAELQAEMEQLVNAADTEQRALSVEEIAKFDAAEQEIRNIDDTIAREERARNVEKKDLVIPEVEERAVMEARAFENYIKQQCGMPAEVRAGEQNLTMANNGAVIPTTIVNRIISTVKEMCPIFAKATPYNVQGTLKVPVYGLSNTSHDIAVGYQTEFIDITADVGQFTSVDLGGYLAGALSLLGKSVINNSQIDVAAVIIKEMSTKIALFLEKELINGTSEKATGAISTTNTLNAGSTSAITADNLIDLQAKVPTIYQKDACWLMAPATFTAVRKLKYGDGKYILQENVASEFPYMLLGKPVYLSDNMPAIGSAAKAVLYGDLSGMSVNMRENVSIQILLEKYATQHAVGVVSWFEFDSKVTDSQKIAALIMSAVG